MTDIAKLQEDIQKLTAIEEIKKLKARYFYCLDRKDWEGWRDRVFCADAVLDVQEARAEPYIGIAAILEMIQTNITGVLTIHHGHMPIIEITSPNTATGLWALEDVLFWPDGRGLDGIDGRLHGYGHYHETYVRESTGWRIKTLRLTRLLPPVGLSS